MNEMRRKSKEQKTPQSTPNVTAKLDENKASNSN
jgi:hypothetical protein